MMNDSHDETTGQFAPNEPLFGEAGIEHEASYVPYQPEDEEPKDDGELTVAEAAEQLAASTPESEIRTYSALDDMPDNVTLTVEQGAKILSDQLAADQAKAAEQEAARIRKEVDELRGDKPTEDQPKEADQAKEPQNAAEIDPDIEKALSHPKIKQALEAHVSQVESVRQQFSQAIDTANKFAQLSFAENFPEIATLHPQQWEGALVAMAQQEPERFKSAINSLNRVAQLDAARQQQTHQQQEQERREFQTYAKAEDARFSEMVKGETPAQLRAIEAEIPQMLSELGVDPLEFLKAGNESRFLRTAAAQKVLVDAAKYRLIQKAPKAVAAKAPLPRVQRPGTATARSMDDDIAALDRELTRTGDIKIAAKLMVAKARARG